MSVYMLFIVGAFAVCAIVEFLRFCSGFSVQTLQEENMKVLFTAVAVLATLCGPVSSRSTGAPAGACPNLTPDPGAHGAPQSTEVPYYVYIDPLCTNGYLMYNPGQEYTRKFGRLRRCA